MSKPAPMMYFPAHWQGVKLDPAGEAMPMAPPRGKWQLPVSAKAPVPAKAPVSSNAAVRVAPRTPPSGPTFNRAQLETLAGGSIASVLGPVFAAQDGYRRQVRMPMPPLLLADRVTGLVGEPGGHGTGVIWTETDIKPDAWYLHHGRMPAGFVVESGQADLLLCSWLGADLKNKGERVYRLLGCDLVFHDGLPGIGDTLEYEIHITGHAELGGIRLFFFHSDCRANGRLIQSVRNGQAGFFTDAELAASDGVIWSPEAAESRPPPGRVDPPVVACRRRSFDLADVQAFAAGRLLDCFGPGFEIGASHTRSPGIPTDRMRLFDRVTDFDPAGGPWARGYLRTERSIASDDWFFEGHFKEDPCMPGTLMCEGGMQAMGFYMAALGITLKRDGWRFEPMPGEIFKMRCRGQLTPTSRLLVTEVFVREVIAGPEPVLRADLLCTVDGQKAFHAAGAALRLAPGWPADLLPAPPRRADGTVDVFSEASAQAVALGRPSLAFGERFARFDSTMRGPRLPGPPYHFITRVVSADIPDGPPRPGARVEAVYDVPDEAWYFDANGARTMPFAVLLEAALQPCGWLATSVGCPLLADREVFFRNLDGTATQLIEVTPGSGRLTTRATLTSVSIVGAMTLVGFDVLCTLGAETVLRVKTGFGFFPEEALANQVGLPLDAADREVLARGDGGSIDMAARPDRLFAGTARLAERPLLMLDRITGHWPTGGRAGLGLIRGEKLVEPREWFFKAHFFQDPVQPGSLGVEALLQLLQAHMLLCGMDAGIAGARFEPLALELESVWKYRGQVVPANTLITTVVELLEQGRDARGAFALASGTLLVDGRKIYQLPKFGMRIVPASAPARGPFAAELTLDPARDVWLQDHAPTFVIPALPMMVTADLLADAAVAVAGERKVVALRGLSVRRWITFPDGARRLRVESERVGADRVALRLLVWREAPRAAMSRFDLLATAEAELADEWPAAPPPWPEVTNGVPMHAPGARNIYAEGDTFHGPAFQHVRELVWAGAEGAVRIDADPGAVPSRLLNPLLLDCLIQAIAGDSIARLDKSLPANAVSFPAVLERLSLFGPAPVAGLVRGRLRYLGSDPADPRFLRFSMQLIQGDVVWAEMQLREVVYEKGHFTGTSPTDRRSFGLRRGPVPGMAVSRSAGGVTRLVAADLAAADWLPGTVAAVYGVPGLSGAALARAVAVKDHLAAAWGVHPALVEVAADGGSGRLSEGPERTQLVLLREDIAGVEVSDPRSGEVPR